jgi:transglutaminase-like putative cysteine protease
MLRIAVRSRAQYDLTQNTYLCLMVEPCLQGSSHRVTDERLVTTPVLSIELRHDLYGNPQRLIQAGPGAFSFEFNATIEANPGSLVPDNAVMHPPHELPPEALIYTLPSRYCQSDLLTRMASSEFGDVAPGAAQVKAIAHWVHHRVEYRYGTTDSETSAFNTATERVGVCRDFAHLVIAFSRALGIPARYVSGYCLGLEPPDFHGYAQVYLGGAWHDVDATIQGVRPALVPIAVGRDAADVAMATIWGPQTLIEQSVEVSQVDGSRP